MPGYLDDAIDMIRRLRLRGNMDDAADPAAVKYLDELGQQDRAWYDRFAFDPEKIYPEDTGAVGRAARAMDQGPPAPADMGIETDLFGDMYKSAGAYDNLRKGRTGNLRNSGGDLARIAGDNIRRMDDQARMSRLQTERTDALQKALAGGAAAAAAGGGIYLATPDTAPPAKAKQEPVDITPPSSTADLAEETRPAPKVEAEPDYSVQARQLINKLNDMRRAAGGEVPEAKAMMAEIDRLLSMGNEQRRKPDFQPGDSASAKFQQAQEILNRLNAMYEDGLSPQSQQAQQMMAQVRALQAEGDNLRNAPRSAAPRVPMHREKYPSGGGTKPLGTSRRVPRRSSPSET